MARDSVFFPVACLLLTLQLQLCESFHSPVHWRSRSLSPQRVQPHPARSLFSVVGDAVQPATPTDSIASSKPASPGAWLPVSVISQLDGTQPTEVIIAGDSWVVWQDPLKKESKTLGWSVMRDECAHRRAPLSQGRVDPESGFIECPYHGWSFEGSTGACKLIPQASAALNTESPNLAAHALSVYVTGDVLWGYFPLPAGQASTYDTLPDTLFPEAFTGPYVS
jgi:nitrite reductase/ring-hydroxylating ferredoxin subunit